MSLVNQFVHKTILQDTKEQYINDQIIVRFRYCQRMANNNGTPLLAHSQILAFPLVMLLSFSAFFVYSVFRACFSLISNEDDKFGLIPFYKRVWAFKGPFFSIGL